MRSASQMAAALVLFGACGLHAQDLSVDTCRMKQPWGSGEEYTFPVVRLASDPAVALSINRDLQAELLSVDPDTAEGHWFDLVWGDSSGLRLPQLSSISWSWGLPVQGVLVVRFSAEACGAYCEGFTNHYCYSLANGRRIRYAELFADSTAASIADTLTERWQQVIAEHLRSLKQSSMVEQTSEDDRIRLYQECLDERLGRPPYVEDIEILPSGIRFTVARCSSHAEQGLDELDAIAIELSSTYIGPLLLPQPRSTIGW